MAKKMHGFDDDRRRVNPLTIVEIVIIAVCAVLIISMLTCYFLFSKAGSTPEIFGKTVYVTNTSNMEPSIPAGSAVFASSDEVSSIAAGDVVLFKIADASSGSNVSVTGILRVTKIEYDANGQLFYTLKGDANSASEIIRIPQQSIIARCSTYDPALGDVINFTTSTMGLLTVVVIPCLLLIVFQIVRIVRIRLDAEDDEFNEDDISEAELLSEFAGKNGKSILEFDDDEDDLDERVPVFETKQPVKRQPKSLDDIISERPVSTVQRKPTAPVREEPPVRKAYVDSEGSARYRNTPAPTTSTEEFRQTVRSDVPTPVKRSYDGEIPSFRSRAAKPVQKPLSYTEPQVEADTFSLSEAAAPHKRIQPEFTEPGHYSIPPVAAERTPAPEPYVPPIQHTSEHISAERDILEEDEPKIYYTKTSEDKIVIPPAVENPVDITIPADAVKPAETIAPPPKENKNKTLEELMRMIDNAK